MYLYDKAKQTIDVYEMSPNFERLKEYRQRELANYPLPEDKRVLKAVTNDGKILENTKRRIPYEELVHNYSDFWSGRYFHDIESYEMTETEQVRQKMLLDSFCEGNFLESQVAIVNNPYDDFNGENLNYLKYLLLTQEKYKSSFVKSFATMDNIIPIPESLYVLQLLEQGNLAKSLEFDISEQLQGFDFSSEPVSRLSINELQRLYQYNLLPGVFEMTMQKVEVTSQVLARRKK